MNDGYQRGQQAARARYGIADREASPLDSLTNTGLNRGKLAAVARTSTDPAERRNAAAILRRWNAPPPEDDGSTAA